MLFISPLSLRFINVIIACSICCAFSNDIIYLPLHICERLKPHMLEGENELDCLARMADFIAEHEELWYEEHGHPEEHKDR